MRVPIDLHTKLYIWPFSGMLVTFFVFNQLLSYGLLGASSHTPDLESTALIHSGLKTFLVWGAFYGLVLFKLIVENISFKELIKYILIYSLCCVILTTSLNYFYDNDYFVGVGLIPALFENYWKPFFLLLISSYCFHFLKLHPENSNAISQT